MNILLIYICDSPEAHDPFGSRLPIGLGYLANAVKRTGHEVRVLNQSGQSDSSLVQVLLGSHWDIVGFTMYTFNRKAVIKATKLVKRESPTTLTVVGGPHPSALPELFPEKFPSIDVAVLGPGEAALCALAQQLYNGKDISTIQAQWKTELYDLPADLDTLGSPSKALFNSSIHEEEEYMYLSSTRGCTGHCTFCSSPSFFPGAPRCHSVNWILEELKFRINTIGLDYISFRDESFTGDRQRVQALCRALMNEKLDFAWDCQCKVTEIDEETVALMAKSGCVAIQLGVEHGSPQMRKLLGKACSDEDIIQATHTITKAGIDASWYLITAIPDETKADRMMTRKLVQKARPTDVIVSPLSLYPGTALFRQHAKRKNLKDDYWLKEQAHWVLPLPKDEAMAIVRKEQTALLVLTS